MVSWQTLKDMGLNIFKKRSRSRTLWIGGSTVGIFGLIAWIVMLTGVSVEFTGDTYCYEECISYVNVTSTYWRICFSEDFELVQTDPDVPVDVYVPTYGKKWRLFDVSKDCIERKNKYNVLPNRFKIVGHKQPTDTIKWSVDRFDVDPKWIGIGVDKQDKIISNCTDVLQGAESSTSIREDGKYPNGTIKIVKIITYTPVYKCIKQKDVNIAYANGTVERVGFDGFHCVYRDPMITCDSCYDGNCDGTCTSGESCIEIDIDKDSFEVHNDKKIPNIVDSSINKLIIRRKK